MLISIHTECVFVSLCADFTCGKDGHVRPLWSHYAYFAKFHTFEKHSDHFKNASLDLVLFSFQYPPSHFFKCKKCILFEWPLSNTSGKPETSLIIQGSLETDHATSHF